MEGQLAGVPAGAGHGADALAGRRSCPLLGPAGDAEGHLAARTGDGHCERAGQTGACSTLSYGEVCTCWVGTCCHCFCCQLRPSLHAAAACRIKGNRLPAIWAAGQQVSCQRYDRAMRCSKGRADLSGRLQGTYGWRTAKAGCRADHRARSPQHSSGACRCGAGRPSCARSACRTCHQVGLSHPMTQHLLLQYHKLQLTTSTLHTVPAHAQQVCKADAESREGMAGAGEQAVSCLPS